MDKEWPGHHCSNIRGIFVSHTSKVSVSDNTISSIKELTQAPLPCPVYGYDAVQEPELLVLVCRDIT